MRQNFTCFQSKALRIFLNKLLFFASYSKVSKMWLFNIENVWVTFFGFLWWKNNSRHFERLGINKIYSCPFMQFSEKANIFPWNFCLLGLMYYFQPKKHNMFGVWSLGHFERLQTFSFLMKFSENQTFNFFELNTFFFV